MMNMQKACASYTNVISTGSLRLDFALPLGGLPRGKIIEIAGTPSSGKSTLSLHIISEAQKKGGNCAFIDTEHTFIPRYATNIGIDKQKLFISQPETAEEALQIVETLTSSYAIDVIVIDSVTALAPIAELQSEMGDLDQGRQARLLKQILPELAYTAKQSDTCLIFTSQTRHQAKGFYGKKESTSSALSFHASLRLELRLKRLIKSGTRYIGQRSQVKITQPGILCPVKKAKFEILFGEGISKSSDLFTLGSTLELIKKQASFYYYLKIPLGKTCKSAKQHLEQTPYLSHQLERHLRQLTGLASATHQSPL